MTPWKTARLKPILFSLAALLFLMACPTSEDGDPLLHIQIDKDNDSLLTFDPLIIKVYSKDSAFVQEVFRGKVEDPKQLQGIKLDPRVGKEYKVSIVGYKNGTLGVNKEIDVFPSGEFNTKDLPISPGDTTPVGNHPELVVPSDTSVREGDSLRLRITLRNAWPGAALTLESAPAGATLDTTGLAIGSAYLLWRPTYSQGRSEPYAVDILYALDGKRVGKKLNIKVLNVNRPPEFQPLSDRKIKVGETLTLKTEAADPDGDTLILTATSLPTGATFSAGTLTWTPAASQEGNHSITFKAFDGHDSDLVAVLITVGDVDAPPPLTVKIVSPSQDTAVNTPSITLTYQVNGVLFQRSFPLKEGRNKLFVDTTVLGRTALDTLIVTLDLVPPGKPTVNGLTPTNSRTPTWTWKSGGSGNGIYRYRLDHEDMDGGTLISDTAYTVPKDLDPGTHTLFVQERDEAGNWSPIGRHAIRIDTTPPPPPTVLVNPTGSTGNTRPTWTWSGMGQDATGLFRFRLDNADLRADATETRGTSFTPTEANALKEGLHTLFVQQQDSAGNWSASGSATVRVDLTPPAKPKFTTPPLSPTNKERPTWTWTSGGQGGMGIFRFNLDDSVLTANDDGSPIMTFTPSADLSSGPHRFYVQERDSAGNWSAFAVDTVVLDFEPPSPPRVTSRSWHTTNTRPTWHWSSGGNGGMGRFAFSLDDSLVMPGLTPITDTIFTPTRDLSRGAHTLYVRERDSAGNWSTSGRYTLHVHGQTGFAAGMNGTLLKTTNGGLSWQVYSGPLSSQSFEAVHFPTPDTGFAAGNFGQVFWTANGGITWELATEGKKGLNAITFPDLQIGVAVGSFGTIYRTANRDTAWESVASGTASLLDVHFADARIGYASGTGGTVFKTENGGRSWSPCTKGTDRDLHSIYFTGHSTGYAVGAGGVILKTNDGGASWVTQSSGTSQALRAVYFVSESTGYAAGESGIFLKTIDSGVTWKLIPITGYTSYIFAVYFIDEGTGFVLGERGTILKTSDGGQSWIPCTSGTTNALKAIYFP